MSAPRISVIIPVRDGARHLARSLDSMLAQTFGDFEAIVVDDGSSDASAAIAAEYSRRDRRIIALSAARGGISAALGVGLRAARGELVARQDHDDVSWPERFARQVRFLDTHPHVGVVGCQVRVIDGGGAVIGSRQLPTTPAEARELALIGCPLVHSAAMIRRSLLTRAGGYRSLYDSAEDYDLWLRLLELTDITNLPEVLLDYRVHAASVSSLGARPQNLRALFARGAALARRAGLPDPTSSFVRVDDAALTTFSRLPPAVYAEWLGWSTLALMRHDSLDDALAWIPTEALRRHRDDPSGRATQALVRSFFERARGALHARRPHAAAREITRAYRVDARVALRVMAAFGARLIAR